MSAPISASFCFMPWEKEPMESPRLMVRPKSSPYSRTRASRASALTPKTSAMKFRYCMPVR